MHASPSDVNDNMSCPSCTCCHIASWPFLCVISNCACFKKSQIELLFKLVVPGSPLGLHTVCHAMQAYGWLVWMFSMCWPTVSTRFVPWNLRCASTATWFLRNVLQGPVQSRQGSTQKCSEVCDWTLVGPDTMSLLIRFKGCYAFQGKPRFALKGVATFES